jgi:hypothetical protein
LPRQRTRLRFAGVEEVGALCISAGVSQEFKRTIVTSDHFLPRDIMTTLGDAKGHARDIDLRILGGDVVKVGSEAQPLSLFHQSDLSWL